MEATQNAPFLKKKLKTAIALAAVIAVAGSAWLAIQHSVTLGRLRAQMEGRMADAAAYAERGNYTHALIAARGAYEPAALLGDEGAGEIAEAYILLAKTVIRADAHFSDGSYQPALSAYRVALGYASKIEGLDTRYIYERISSAEGYISFFDIMRRAGSLAGMGEYETAQALYDEAAETASAIPYESGRRRAMEGAEYMEEQIALAKWRAEMLLLAETHMSRGDLLLDGGRYAPAIEEYQSAMDAYSEINHIEGTDRAASRIARAVFLQAEASLDIPASNTPDDATAEGPDADGNAGTVTGYDITYDYNRAISFDLSTMIDRQDREPASLVKMGTAEGMNEGWYNGCGWIATYNLLLMLGDPRHPADIVRYFETSGGTVMDGVFGTYPHAIEGYLAGLGYDVEHTLFPGARLSIDSAIKSAGAGIVAYAHTGAAHYVAIEYRDSDGMYIVYNDSSARSRSNSLGFSDLTTAGAAIGSVDSWLIQTPAILFAFSLITVG